MDLPALDARPTGDGVLIVCNPRSGQAVPRADPRQLLAERLTGSTVRELEDGQGFEEVVAETLAGENPPDVLGVLGGDGSVSRMADVARRHGMPLLVLPGGTFNHFARSIGVDSVDAAIDAVQGGSGREVTVVEVSADGEDPLTVLTAVSVGTYPAFIEKREQRERFGKWFGGFIAMMKELREAQPVEIAREGRRAHVWSVFVGVGRNEPDLVATVERQSVDDGVLDIRVHHAHGSRLQAVASLAFGKRTTAILRGVGLMPKHSDLERLVLSEFTFSVRPGAGRPSVFVHDGELEERDPAGFTLQCRAVPSALRVYAPPR
jgi:diacylglycerol kinase family enzyme